MISRGWSWPCAAWGYDNCHSGSHHYTEFAKHFLDKIEKNRSKLTTTRPYTPKTYNTPALWRFTTLTEDQLYRVIIDMPTKSCELDIISTKLLKQVLHGCIPAIMKIINLSLDKGDFSSHWTSVVVCPLIKSLSNCTNNENYRPVSNLPFISKVAEKCTLQQLSDHCDTYDLLPEYNLLTVKQVCLNSQMTHNGEWKIRTSLQS